LNTTELKLLSTTETLIETEVSMVDEPLAGVKPVKLIKGAARTGMEVLELLLLAKLLLLELL